MFRKITISILMLMLSNVGYSMISKSEWVSLCENATGQRRYTCELLRQQAGVIPSAFSGNWGKTYKKLASFEYLSLTLESLQISDLTPLAGFTNLTNLYLGDNQISDITPLDGLTNIKNLFLHRNEISNIYPLMRLKKIEKLDLLGNKISDLSPLAGLTNLKEIGLERNNISDIASLSDLKNTKVLNLTNNKISDLSPLAGLNKIVVLNLIRNHISDISSLAKLKNLTGLTLQNNQITDISPLTGLKDLNTLGLADNQISDISPLDGLMQLKALSLSGNQISDFGSFSSCIDSETKDSQQETATSPFYAKMMEETSDTLAYHKKFSDLSSLIEDVHQMKFHYTYVMNGYRMGTISIEDRDRYIKSGLEKSAFTLSNSKSVAIYKSILRKSVYDKVITDIESDELDSDAEDHKTSKMNFITDLQDAVKANTARIEGLEVNVETLQENIESINASLNKVKKGIERKIAIETGVGVMGAILNAVSFGAAGSLLQGAMNASLAEMVDFGDIIHLQKIAQNNNLGDSFSTGLNTFEATTANRKLEKAIKNKDTMSVITAIAVAIPTDRSDDGFSSSTSSVPLAQVIANTQGSVVSNLDAGLSDDESDDESDDGLSDDEEETVFDYIQNSDLEALKNHIEDFTTAEQLKESFKAEVKEKGENSLKYSISLKNVEAIKIIGEKAVSLGLISSKKLKKYVSQAAEA